MDVEKVHQELQDGLTRRIRRHGYVMDKGSNECMVYEVEHGGCIDCRSWQGCKKLNKMVALAQLTSLIDHGGSLAKFLENQRTLNTEIKRILEAHDEDKTFD